MWKQLLLVALLSTSVFARRQRIAELEEENSVLQTDLRSARQTIQRLEGANKEFNDRVSELNSTVARLQQENTEKDARIAQLQDELRTVRASRQNASQTPAGSRVVVERPTPTIQFPIEATIMDRRDHDRSNVAMRLSFYNGSRDNLQSFVANVRFMIGDKLLNEVLLQVSQPVRSGENVTWFGAIPYDRNNSDHMIFYNMPTENIDVVVEVHSIVTSGGQSRNFLR